MHERRVEDLKEQSVSALLRELADQTTTLVRQEIELAKVELTEKAKAAGGGVVWIGFAALFAAGACGAVTTALIAALALTLPLWAAAAIVAVAYAVIAAVFAVRGRNGLRAATPIVPAHTSQTVKEDIEWLKTRAQSSKR